MNVIILSNPIIAIPGVRTLAFLGGLIKKALGAVKGIAKLVIPGVQPALAGINAAQQIVKKRKSDKEKAAEAKRQADFVGPRLPASTVPGVNQVQQANVFGSLGSLFNQKIFGLPAVVVFAAAGFVVFKLVKR